MPARTPVSAVLGAAEPAYRVSTSQAGLHARSHAQHLEMRFGRSGIQLTAAGAKLGLSLQAVGYGATLHAVRDVAPSAHANRVVYARVGLGEWYVNGPLGLEQGFTLPRAPVGLPAGPLTLSMALSGNVRALLDRGSDSVTLRLGGRRSLRYGGLVARDASGRTLRSWLELRPGRLLLGVDTRGAHYPVRIDPLIQQGEKLTAGEAIGEPELGRSVALSGDGNTALVGGSADNGEAGAAWVFTRSGQTWTQQARLTGSEEVGAGAFGAGVALSSDGNTAVIGGPHDNGEAGAAWVFTRSGQTWTQQGAKLTGGGEVGEGKLGRSVALSSDGNTALIGGWGDNGAVGAAWVFARSGSTWTQQGAKLTGGGEAGSGEFGFSVALSADANTAMIGGFSASAAWPFTRSGSTWTQQGSQLTGSGATFEGFFGSSVALSANGNTAMIGASNDNGGVGAAWAFTRSGSTWTEQGSKLTASGEIGKGSLGASLALSSDGNTAAIGGLGDNERVGAAWMFARSGATWTQQGAKLTGSEEVGEGRFGTTVALSADANTAAFGGESDNVAEGAVWMFVNPAAFPPTVSSVSPNKGPLAGATSVTITGTNFAGATAVKFGSANAASFKVISETSIGAVAPAGTGTVDVTVTRPGGTSATGAADQFSYVAPPTVTSVNPSKGSTAGATSVTITGTNLTGATAIKFGSTGATSFTVESASTISAVAPAGTGTVDVTVTTVGGTSATSSGDQFSYVPPPTVTGVSPNKGSLVGGANVTVSGTNLTGATAIRFGSANATSFTVESSGAISAVAPAGTGTVDVTVTTVGGVSATSSADQFSYVPPPTVTGVSPTEGPTPGGSSVTITGTNLTAATAVKFGSTGATSFTVESASTISAVAPAGTGTVDVTVTTTGGTSATSSADQFSYVAPPTVTEVSPSEGPTGGGNSVTVTGTNLTGATAVKFGSASAAGVVVKSASTISAVAPAGAGTVDVTVTTPGGTSATGSSDQFSYVSAPTVTGVSPGAGLTSGKTGVTITGTRFTGATVVKFGSASATSVTVVSAKTITAISPTGTGTVDVTVTTPGGTSATSAGDRFVYVPSGPAPAVTKVSPSSGVAAGGTTVTISGKNFSGVTAVKFGSTGATSFTATSSSSITAITPAAAAEAVDVTVTTPNGTSVISAKDHFKFGPPTVTSVSPATGPRAGGTSVTVTGTGFVLGASATSFEFGKTPATSVNCTTSTTCVAVAPSTTKAGAVDVTATVGKASSAKSPPADRFTYT